MATTTKRKAAAKKKTTTKKKTTAKKKTAAKKKATTKKKTAVKRKTAATKKTAAKGKVMAKSKATATKRPLAAGGPVCPITRAEFSRGAEAMHLQIMSAGESAGELDLDPREFSSGSFGWFASEKIDVPVGRTLVRCQLSLNVTVIGSKNSK